MRLFNAIGMLVVAVLLIAALIDIERSFRQNGD